MDAVGTCPSASITTQETSTSVPGNRDQQTPPSESQIDEKEISTSVPNNDEQQTSPSGSQLDEKETSTSVPNNDEQQTSPSGSQIDEKKDVIFKPHSKSFQKAVKWRGFIDRTMLIAELLNPNEANNVLIFAPKRFGKSMNIDMIRCFLEIETDRDVSNAPQDLEELKKFENFQAFCRYGLAPSCAILNETDLVREYFGRNPVIHLSFKRKRETGRSISETMRRVVHEAYSKHEYLQKTMTKTDKRFCEAWCNEMGYRGETAVEALEKLIEYLHAYHKRKVYLLIDEFDAPAAHVFRVEETSNLVKRMNDEVRALLGVIVKGEVANEHLLGSLITGVSYLQTISISEHVNDLSVYRWLSKASKRFINYYGLGNDELTPLLEHIFPDSEQQRLSVREEIVDLYSGYYFKDKPYYCLWSVLHYIRARSKSDASSIQEKTFWTGSTIILTTDKLLQSNEIMERMLDLISGNYISFTPSEKVDAQKLTDFVHGKKGKAWDLDIIFSFFLEQGYLSHVPHRRENIDESVGEVRVKVPNMEVLVTYRRIFKNFFVYIRKLSFLEMQQCAGYFKRMSIEEAIEVDVLELLYECLCKLVRGFEPQMDMVNERLIQIAMYTTMLLAGFEECCVNKIVAVETKDQTNTGKIPLWLRHNDFAVIWEFKYDGQAVWDSVKESSRQACSEILFGDESKGIPPIKILDEYPNKVNKYLLIGFSTNSELQLAVSYLRNSQNLDDCVVFPK